MAFNPAFNNDFVPLFCEEAVHYTEPTSGSFHPNRTCTQILVKVCTLVKPINEIKKGAPHTTFGDRGPNVHPSGVIYFVKESHATILPSFGIPNQMFRNLETY